MDNIIEEKVIEYINKQKGITKKWIIRELILNAIEIPIMVILLLKLTDSDYLYIVFFAGILIILATTHLNIISIYGSMKKFTQTANLCNIYNEPKQYYDSAVKDYHKGKITEQDLLEAEENLNNAIIELYDKIKTE